MLTIQRFLTILKRKQACGPALAFVAAQESVYSAWHLCAEEDWAAWLIEELMSVKTRVLLGVLAVRRTLEETKKPLPEDLLEYLLVLDLLERWALGEKLTEELLASQVWANTWMNPDKTTKYFLHNTVYELLDEALSWDRQNGFSANILNIVLNSCAFLLDGKFGEYDSASIEYFHKHIPFNILHEELTPKRKR